MTIDYVLQAAKKSAKLPETLDRIDCIQFGPISDQCPDDKMHAFGDWNQVGGWSDDDKPKDDTLPRLSNVLEKRGVECEWYDEWASCDGCEAFFRTSPDCHDWWMYGVIDEHGCYCGQCIKDDPEEYLASRIDNPRSAVNTDLVDPEEHGFVLLDEEYENGCHPGQDDDPSKILAALQEEFPEHAFVFTYQTNQFYVSFQAWKRPRREE